MVDHTNSFDVDDGLGPCGEDEPKVFSGPTVPNFLAPIGSVYFRDTLQTYRFAGPLAADWVERSSPNFSFHTIPSGTTIEIPINEQMVVCDEICIEEELCLPVNSELVVIGT